MQVNTKPTRSEHLRTPAQHYHWPQESYNPVIDMKDVAMQIHSLKKGRL